MAQLDLCKRCGKCCIASYKGITKECRFLVRNADNTTFCRIYPQRLGTILARIHNVAFYCNMRENLKEDIDGCPYNTGKPIRKL